MEFTDYMIWKLIGLCAIVCVWQFFRGLNGLPPEVGNDKPTDSNQDQ